jgi:hypothetical protein
MVKHIVCFKLKDHAEGATKAENARMLKARIEAMRGAIPGMLELEVGLNFEPSDAAYDLVLFATFASRAALDAYQQHPAHLAVVDVLRRVRDQRIVVDWEAE